MTDIELLDEPRGLKPLCAFKPHSTLRDVWIGRIGDSAFALHKSESGFVLFANPIATLALAESKLK